MVAKSRELKPDRSARDLYGAEIRRYRNNAGISLEALSGVVMYSRAHLARVETAEVIPGLPQTERYARAIFTVSRPAGGKVRQSSVVNLRLTFQLSGDRGYAPGPQSEVCVKRTSTSSSTTATTGTT